MNKPAESYLFTEDVYQLPSRTVVLIDRPWEQVTEDGRALLAKILGSVKLGMPGVYVLSGAEFSIERLGSYRPQRVISFGSTVKEVSNLYEPAEALGIPVIIADALDKLDDQRKKNLWQGLRKMFNF